MLLLIAEAAAGKQDLAKVNSGSFAVGANNNLPVKRIEESFEILSDLSAKPGLFGQSHVATEIEKRQNGVLKVRNANLLVS